MDYTKQKFILEIENYFKNFPNYTIGEVLYSLQRNFKDKSQLLEVSDEVINNELQKSQMFETDN